MKREDDDLFVRKLPPVHKPKAKKILNLVLSDYKIMAAKNLSGLYDCYACPSS